MKSKEEIGIGRCDYFPLPQADFWQVVWDVTTLEDCTAKFRSAHLRHSRNLPQEVRFTSDS
jgi:hypothetical protein